MTETKLADLVGLAEISERCKISRNVASGWTRKHDFPRPVHKLRMGPLWDWREVEEYLFGPDPRNQLTLAVCCASCGGDTILGDTNPVTFVARCDSGHKTRVQIADMAILEGPIQTTVRTLKEDA